jgi:cytochrome c oxidase subunit II
MSGVEDKFLTGPLKEISGGYMLRIVSALAVTFILATAISSAETVQEIKITATKFQFSPNEITVKKGQPVKLEVLSSDANHGLAIKALNIRTEAKKGDTATLEFTPTEVGTLQGKCSHFCGKGHGSMILTVHVVE